MPCPVSSIYPFVEGFRRWLKTGDLRPGMDLLLNKVIGLFHLFLNWVRTTYENTKKGSP